MSNNDVFMSGIGYALGELHDVDALEELRRQPDLLESLLVLGLKTYTRVDVSPATLAKRAMIQTLERTGIAPTEVSAVVYGTTSFWCADFYRRQEISRVMHELGLVNAYPIGVTLSECANLQSALRVAVNLVRSEGHSNVLLVVTDRISDHDSRIVPPQISVKSDGAAACLVTRGVPGDYEICAIEQSIDTALWDMDVHHQVAEYLRKTADGIKVMIGRMFARLGKCAADFDFLVPNNYNISVLRTFGALLGFDPARIYMENVRRTAHVVAADNLINLKDLADWRPLRSDALVLLLGSGPNLWGCTVLRKT